MTTIVPAETTPLRLLIVGPAVVTSVALPGAGRVAIGRAAECEVHVDDHSISRNHAVIELDLPLRIVDSGSANGTWIAERRIAAHEPVQIDLEQPVRLGSVTFIVQRGEPLPDPTPEDRERQKILDALASCHGNQTHAAALLGISRRTMINKLDKFALPRPRKR